MPSKNSRKVYVEDHYYHAYNRGVEKRLIFLDDKDYSVFLNLLKRHLSQQQEKDKYGRQYKNYYHDLELLAFCLMPNHFHLLFYLKSDITALPNLMRLVSNTYANYFNQKHTRVGHLFQDRFKASLILRDDYLQHISRYIHLNPKDYKIYEWSSLAYYDGRNSCDWVRPGRIVEIFDSVADYCQFLSDFKDYKESLEEVKKDLANF